MLPCRPGTAEMPLGTEAMVGHVLGRRPPELPFPRLFPSAYGTLTVRSLLDTREHCLNEFNFPDPYSKVSAA